MLKFKYNFCEKKLWRVEEDYFYQLSAESRHIEYSFMRGAKVTFKLGENHWLVFQEDEFNTTDTVCYTKPDKNGELVYYEKKLARKWFGLEVERIFEFTEADRQRPTIEQRTPI